jgi:amphi-Trp domain-containing protein
LVVVSDLELERKESVSRAEAAKRLAAFADALASGGRVELDLGGTSLSMRVAENVRTEFEVEVDGDEIEVEIELSWSTSPSRGAAPSRAQHRGNAGDRAHDAGRGS